ncbi:MAG TPA: TetR/AcrR family transcriptional regulator [Acidimicrobiales bacterium]|jgi:AcrR family transcriptional regulator|nr:TetR/AcrR family transcriptional regulator [Acidimicrobiales bacterium]
MAASRLPAPERRRQLAEVAIETFARKGYDPTSMEEIAEAAGVTKPVLYQHFRSKRALYLELLDYVGGQLLEAIGSATAAADSPRRQVEAGFAAYFRFVAEHPWSFRLLFGSGAQRDPEFDAEVRRVESTIAEAVAAMIEADIDPAHRRLLAHAVVGLAEATSRYWMAERSRAEKSRANGSKAPDPERAFLADPGHLARRIADLAWAGLRAIHRD